MARVCQNCGKGQKSSSGYERHRKVCKATKSHLKSKGISKADDSIAPYISTEAHWQGSNGDGPEEDWYNPKEEAFEGYNRQEKLQERFDPLKREGYNIDGSSPIDWELRSNQSDLEMTQDSSTHQEQAHRSRHSSILFRTLTFEEATGNGAGVPLDTGCQTKDISFENPQVNGNSLFESSFDYFFATWLRSSGISKGNVDKLLKDARAKPLNNLLSFNNGNEWHHKVESLSSGMNHCWRKTVIPVQAQFRDQENVEYVALYQDVIEAVRFLLGHSPFANNLVYAPVKDFDSSESRIYSEMNTAEWWWETQLLLPNNATLVPLLLASDKTLLSQHQGDVTAWPVYLTIGNLDRRTRRSQTRPGQVLLGFLPVLPKSNDETRATMWHKVMGIMLKPIRDLAREGFAVLCADGETRHCHPVIGGFSGDTEEQFVITGVKTGQHCTICIVPSDERENLELESPSRTHERTQEQIKIQLERNTKSTDKNWVHPIENFAWEHAYVNIHQAMMLDPLHQLYKGIMGQHLRKWVLQEITAAVKAERKRKGITITDEVLNADANSRLDERFRRVPKCEKLIVFKNYSDRKQWTGLEDRNLLRQFIPVITPFLLSTAPDVLQLARAIVDFILLATYVSHNEETLQYLKLALYRINSFKHAVSEYRPKGHFNFPKFHVMSHYPDFIRKYGAADNFDTEHGEANHKIHVKVFYPLTNKQDGYLEQIIKHGIRRLNSVAAEDKELYCKTVLTTLSREQTEAHVSTAAREISLDLIDGLPLKSEKNQVRSQKLNPKHWCTARSLENATKIPQFLASLAVFVRQQRYELSKTSELYNKSDCDRLEEDASWVESLLVCVHGSLKCWSRKGKDAANLDKLESHHVRCKPKWRSSRSWRRDWVLVQETAVSGEQTDDLNGRLPGQLQIVVSVQDPERRIQGTNKLVKYTGALIEVMRPRNGGKVHDVHGMIEVERWPSTSKKGRRKLSNLRFYPMPTILRSVHLVPASLKNDGVYFINNYFDWDMYNTFYDPDFQQKQIRAASRYNPDRAKKEKAKKRDEAWLQETDDEENGEEEDSDDENASTESDSHDNIDGFDDEEQDDEDEDESNFQIKIQTGQLTKKQFLELRKASKKRQEERTNRSAQSSFTREEDETSEEPNTENAQASYDIENYETSTRDNGKYDSSGQYQGPFVVIERPSKTAHAKSINLSG